MATFPILLIASLGVFIIAVDGQNDDPSTWGQYIHLRQSDLGQSSNYNFLKLAQPDVSEVELVSELGKRRRAEPTQTGREENERRQGEQNTRQGPLNADKKQKAKADKIRKKEEPKNQQIPEDQRAQMYKEEQIRWNREFAQKLVDEQNLKNAEIKRIKEEDKQKYIAQIARNKEIRKQKSEMTKAAKDNRKYNPEWVEHCKRRDEAKRSRKFGEGSSGASFNQNPTFGG